MIKELLKKLITVKKTADQEISKMSVGEREKLEKTWDVEHAYYSSALEGSKLDRKEFDELARQVK